MYRILYNESTIFDPYGNENEVVTDASMSVEINAAAYLDFTMSRLHPLYDTIAERDGVVTLYWGQKILFQGVIESIDMDIQGNKSISCVSALDYLNDTVVRPYSTIAGEQELTAPSSVDGYFQWLIDQHNDHVLDAGKLFEVGVNQGANLQQNNFIYRSSTNNPTTASEITDQLLDSLGGYLTMRYVDDRRVLDLYSDIHTMNAQVIDFGVNITDFSKTIDTKDQYTALLLKGGSPEFLGGDFEDGSFDYWVSHPNTPISTGTVHGGTYSSFFTEGNGEYINSSFFYAKKGARYKSTVWIKNERSSTIKAYPRYQVYEAGEWVGKTIDGGYDVPNDGEWHEYSFDFMPNLEDYVRIRPRWVFDTVGNDGNKRVYVDDFDFRQVEGDTDVTEDPISVAMVPDGGMQYDANILKTGDVIYDPTAVARYGYKEKVYEDSTITDVDDLLQAGVKALNKLKDPQIGLDIKAVDLALFMDGYDHLNVGDAVRVRSAIHDTDEFLMVTSITLDLQDPGQSEYNIGKAYDSLTGQQSGFLRSLNSGINSSLDAVASLDQTAKDQAIQLGAVENVANQAQQTANNAQNTANNAQNTANANKEAINSIKDAQTEYEKQLEQMQQGVADAEQEIGQVNKRIEGMNSEIESAKSDIEVVRTEAQRNFETAKSAADAAASKADAAQADVDALRSSTSTELQNVKNSVSNVQSDVADALQQASDLAEDLDATKATVEQTVTEFGEVKTTATNAASKADQSLRVSTEASQTATQASQTATSAYEDSQKAITQSSQAVQTANQVSLNLSTNYQTKADADAKYATQASLTATSNQIKTEVSATYATKAAVEGLENIANNAVQTWMGSGVPTLSNKPASDWTTAELKSQHSGDIYYDSGTGYSYRFGSSDGKNYSWALIKDTDISKAVADAAKAQQTAEGVSDEVTQLKTDIPATYATKTEVKQTTDSIKSTVSEAASTANSALSKVSSLEVSVDGIDAKVEENASDIADAVRTTSQVSQRVDSVSSTITQVSGRVDDVEDTADEALSKSSQLSQDLSGFKTSVQQTYETKQDALSKQSQLQQTINGFRTEVSEEYTTKDEFNALEIGGTNLVIGSKPYGKSGFFRNFATVSNDEYGEVTLQSTTESQSYPHVEIPINDAYSFDPRDVVKGEKYVISYDIMMLERTYTNSSAFTESWIGIRNQGGSWSGIIKYDGIKTDFLGAPLNEWAHFEHVVTSGQAESSTISIVSDIQFGTKSIGKFHFRMRNVKIEKGTKATAWSPAPEDFDGKYTSKTEFAQTTESIKATAQSAATNASSALSKVSSLEVSVDGIDAKVEENASDIADAVKTTSQVSLRVDSLTSTITQVSDNVNNMQIGGTNLLKLGAYGFHSAVTGASYDKTNDLYKFTVPANATTNNSWGIGLNTHKGKSYVSGGVPWQKYGILSFYIHVDHACQINIDVNTQAWTGLAGGTGNDHDTNRSHSSLSIPANQWTQVWSRWQNANTNSSTGNPNKVDLYDCSTIGVLSTSSAINVQIKKLKFEVGTKPTEWSPCPADVDADVDSAASTANSALSQSSTVQQELTSFKTSVQQTYETKTDALNKQSSLQQSVNNLRTEVSERYTTKSEFNDLTIGGTNRALLTATAKTMSGTATANQCVVVYSMPDDGYALFGSDPVMLSYDVTASGSSLTGTYRIQGNGDPGWEFATGSKTRNLADIGNGKTLHVEDQVKFSSASTFTAFQVRMDNATGTLTFSNFKIEKGTKPTAWSPAPEDMLSNAEAAQTYSTKSYVDQTARTVSLGVVEEYKDGQHGSALATQSDITAAKDSITSTVSQTYATKNDVGVGNLIRNGDFSDGSSNWTTAGGTSKVVDGTYGKQFVFTQTGPNTNGNNRTYNPSYNHINGQSYEVSFYAKADKSSKWHFGPNTSSKAASVTLDTTLKQYTMQYQADGTTVLSVWTDNPTATIYLERVKLSIASGYYATKTEVKQTSDSLTVTISSAISKAESAQNTANAAKKQTYNTVNASSGTAGYFRFATLKITDAYTNRPIYFSLSNRGQKASNVWVQFNSVNSTDPTLNYIQADGGMNVWIHKTATSTWEMIAQKSEGYDTLYVNDYANNNNITVTWVNAFLSSVPSGSTQATRLASKRPSSDIDNAQSTANTANSNAQNAQNRVGNLETCIKMTSDGVRVGKISNGNFTGYSALVNSAGSFDVLDSSGNAVSRFAASSIELGKNSKTSTVSMCGGVVKFSSNSGGTSLAIDTQDQGPITINDRQLGMFGRACQFGSGSYFRTTAKNQWVKATLTPQYINSDGVTATSIKPFASYNGGVTFNVTGLYLISISAYAGDVAHLDVCHLGLMNSAGTIQMEQQVCAGGNWDGITHTECRRVTAGTTLWMAYKCENASGSSMVRPFMTCAFLSYVN